MQVEVSKYTEGLSEKRMRPNEMPVSLIHYDGEPSAFSCLALPVLALRSSLTTYVFFDTVDRQKETAMSSITEVVQTVKHPRARSEGEQEPVEPAPPVMASPLVAPGTPSGGASLKSPLWDVKKEDSRLSRKSSRRSSLMGSVPNSDTSNA
jgi:phototropin